MATYYLFEPGKPTVSGQGGWGDMTQSGEDLDDLKALHDPTITQVVDELGCGKHYKADYPAHIIQVTSGTPPNVTLVAVSGVSADGNLIWDDNP